MSRSNQEALADFVADAPPGELNQVVEAISTVVDGNPSILSKLEADVHNKILDQCMVVSLGKSKTLVSKYNQLSKDTFYDSQTGQKFEFGFDTKKATPAGSHDSDSPIQGALDKYFAAHFPSEGAAGVFPQEDGSIAIVLVDGKYNPANYWNGKWRSVYIYESGSLSGSIDVDVHYYEDGNVRLKSSEKVDLVSVSESGIVDAISKAEQKFQEKLNKSFNGLNEDSFKALRRQLPVTRSKINWGKSISNYRLGKDINVGGGRE
ncbi:F-actin-capping protein subunit alpha [Yarrowia sp. B02]|nr:F-actin-capping protein subunit alpha [Yarrowia sp. B02]